MFDTPNLRRGGRAPVSLLLKGRGIARLHKRSAEAGDTFEKPGGPGIETEARPVRSWRLESKHSASQRRKQAWSNSEKIERSRDERKCSVPGFSITAAPDQSSDLPRCQIMMMASFPLQSANNDSASGRPYPPHPPKPRGAARQASFAPRTFYADRRI
jgi:hypothetical protein